MEGIGLMFWNQKIEVSEGQENICRQLISQFRVDDLGAKEWVQ